MTKDQQIITSIVHTLAFFAAHNRAVTLLELYELLVKCQADQEPVGLEELQAAVHSLIPQRVSTHHGLYTLAGYELPIKTRLHRYNDSAILLKKARHKAALLRHLPYIRAVAISGSAALLNAGPQSDIDLLIITAPGRIFTARFFATALFQFLGSYRHGDNISGRFCPNHYVVADYQLREDHNLYTAAEYASLVPLFGMDYIQAFWGLNWTWMEQYVLQPPAVQLNPSLPHHRASLLQSVLETLLIPLGPLVEPVTRYLQQRRIKKSEYVVVSNEELSFHPGSKGQTVLKRYQAILAGSDPTAAT